MHQPRRAATPPPAPPLSLIPVVRARTRPRHIDAPTLADTVVPIWHPTDPAGQAARGQVDAGPVRAGSTLAGTACGGSHSAAPVLAGPVLAALVLAAPEMAAPAVVPARGSRLAASAVVAMVLAFLLPPAGWFVGIAACNRTRHGARRGHALAVAAMWMSAVVMLSAFAALALVLRPSL